MMEARGGERRIVTVAMATPPDQKHSEKASTPNHPPVNKAMCHCPISGTTVKRYFNGALYSADPSNVTDSKISDISREICTHEIEVVFCPHET
ncbi:hypothetical protein CDAR_13071 [Caerostris darwini]|uniref:Uncharacterized protein n=1 Tax=Caerostris darwini TaxID=1538125 RepID=A0AAV4Q5N8_9ARAC|nr:hypothetical protein CDAR_13071 [Caerostris darwini]